MLNKSLLACAALLFCAVEAQADTSIHALNTAEIAELSAKNVLSNNPVVDPSRLRRVDIDYVTFEGQKQQGHIMVMDAVAPYVVNVFKTLYGQKFPIHDMKMMEHFHGDDALALTANNSSAFNDRAIIGQTNASLHAYGAAVDINPIQNPFVEMNFETGAATYSPIDGIKYANRQLNRPGKPYRPGMAEEVVALFAANGFTTWGGNWDFPIDYQHFQTSRDLAVLLSQMNSEDAIAFFSTHVTYYNKCKSELFDALDMSREDVIALYEKDSQKFMLQTKRQKCKK